MAMLRRLVLVLGVRCHSSRNGRMAYPTRPLFDVLGMACGQPLDGRSCSCRTADRHNDLAALCLVGPLDRRRFELPVIDAKHFGDPVEMVL